MLMFLHTTLRHFTPLYYMYLRIILINNNTYISFDSRLVLRTTCELPLTYEGEHEGTYEGTIVPW